MSAAQMIEYKVRARRRVARKRYLCDDERHNCLRVISSGDVYGEVTIYPGHDVITLRRPVRIKVCARCSSSRIDLDPIPYDQCCRDGLL